jgi:sulfate adenylyltransferase subunit 1 (EFTu-like GTPase family)
MAAVGATTLMMAVQAVHRQIRHYEGLLESGSLRDPQEIWSLVLAYEAAARELKMAYRRGSESNLPEYEVLVR